jgi:hypothetical protein
MSDLRVPEFRTCEEEASYWDNLDTADAMDDDGEWFTFETPSKRAVRVAILPEVANDLAQRARGFLIHRTWQPAVADVKR